MTRSFPVRLIATGYALMALTVGSIVLAEQIIIDGATSLKLGEYSLRLDGKTRTVIDTEAKTISIGSVAPHPPGPGPDPIIPVPIRPTGFAGLVFDEVIKLNRREDAAQLAGSYATVVREIDDGKHADADSAGRRLKELNDALLYDRTPWGVFGELIKAEFKRSAVDLRSTRFLMNEVATGLKVASQ